eukprot:3863579-Alexandrium_andersonii.AAC.1
MGAVWRQRLRGPFPPAMSSAWLGAYSRAGLCPAPLQSRPGWWRATRGAPQAAVAQRASRATPPGAPPHPPPL